MLSLQQKDRGHMHNGGKVSPYLLLVRRRRGKKEREKSKRKWEKEFFFSCRCKKGTSCFFFFSFKCQAERSQASLLSTTFRAHTSSCPGGTLTSRLLVHFPFHFHFFSFLFLFFFFFFGANVFFLLFVSPGMGSQGHVCSANDEVTKKQVAIKKILHSFQDVEMAKRQV